MEDLIEELKAWGAAPEAGIRRMLGDEAFYLKLLKQFAMEKDWEELSNLLDQEKYEQALIIAHRMKGSVVDLELYPIAEALGAVVEDLRGSVSDTLPEDLRRLWKKREELEKLFVKEMGK